MKRRVVITGMGAVTPVGNDLNSFWDGIKQGKNGIDIIKAFDVENYKVKLAAEVKDFNPDIAIEKKEARRMDRFCQFAMVASNEAILDSKLDLENIDRTRLGVIVGSGIGGLSTIETQDKILNEKGPRRVSPFLIPMIIGNIAAGNVAIKYGAKGVCTSVVTACATGTNSIGDAFRLIRDGYQDYMICGGCEGSITPLGLAGFQNLTALSTSLDKDKASIPFDKNRDGFVMGEGAGVLIIETLDSAIKRKANIYAEILGYGSTCDAYHVTSPSVDGEGAARAMEDAIKDGEIEKKDIDYINAHGTSTPLNDKFESLAIKKAFNDLAYNIPISSTKSMTGHLLGAAGAIEAIICAKALQEGFIPATINSKEKDEECDLDIVMNEGREKNIEYALSNSLGFGGHNAVLLFKKYNE
ncbi:MAG: beta-ketoacyl-ACP synthase II [Clostridiaceae bacterium]